MFRLVVAVALVACNTTDPPHPTTGIQLRNPSGTVTEGDVTVAATADRVYAALTDYARWPVLFPYLDKVTLVAQHDGVDEVTTLSRKGKTHRLVFRNEPARRIVRFTELDGRADTKAEITLVPAERARSTLIAVRLEAEVRGVAGLLVSDATVRAKREAKVLKDLEFLRSYFASE
jgi:uncharacterized membrane protein